MSGLVSTALLASMTALVCACSAAAEVSARIPDPGELDPIFQLAPPETDGPVVVHVAFEVHDINEIDDLKETFSFTGLLRLEWIDPRVAFEPGPGADEKVYQGNYQFNEVASGWYPQVVLVNESGGFESNGVVLRITPDGRSTLLQTVMGTVESDFDMRWFPFDSQRLEIIFTVLGFERDEVRLEAKPGTEDPLQSRIVRIPQWEITGASSVVEDRSAANPGRPGTSAAYIVQIDVGRNSVYVRRLVTFPLAVIVLLSFCVFWMDRSSLGDRISVSFIGILTAVTYQLIMWDVLPHISYFTLIHGYLMLSFLTMCGTVAINLVVGAYDKAGRSDVGDRIDSRCRWLFPLGYALAVGMLFASAELFFSPR